MTVAIVVLADQYAGWFGPLIEWILAHHLAVRYKLLILLAAEQGAEVVVQPAATIVTLIHDTKGEKIYYQASFEGDYDLWCHDLKENKTSLMMTASLVRFFSLNSSLYTVRKLSLFIAFTCT